MPRFSFDRRRLPVTASLSNALAPAAAVAAPASGAYRVQVAAQAAGHQVQGLATHSHRLRVVAHLLQSPCV